MVFEFFGLKKERPKTNRSKTSEQLVSSTHMNPSSSGRKSGFPVVMKIYSRIPMVLPPPLNPSRTLVKMCPVTGL